MILNQRQQKELLEAAKPLIEWVNENCHPHSVVVVDQNSAELLETVARAVTHVFIKD